MPGTGLFTELAGMAFAAVKAHPKLLKYAAIGGLSAPVMLPVYWRTAVNTWSGKSLLMAGADALIDDEFSEKGFLGTTKKLMVGNEAAEKSTGEILVDEMAGQGTFAKGREVIGNTVDGAGNALAYVGGTVRGAVDGVGRTFNSVGDVLSAAVDQHFAVTQEQQTQRERELAQMAAYYKAAYERGYYPETMPTGQQYPMQQSQDGGFSSMLSPFTNLINGFTGSSSNTMSAAGMLLGAFMLFGGLGGGMLSRVIGGALGGYAFRKMAKPQAQATAYPSVDSAQYQQFLRENYERQYQQSRQQQNQGGAVNRTFTI